MMKSSTLSDRHLPGDYYWVWKGIALVVANYDDDQVVCLFENQLYMFFKTDLLVLIIGHSAHGEHIKNLS